MCIFCDISGGEFIKNECLKKYSEDIIIWRACAQEATGGDSLSPVPKEQIIS